LGGTDTGFGISQAVRETPQEALGVKTLPENRQDALTDRCRGLAGAFWRKGAVPVMREDSGSGGTIVRYARWLAVQDMDVIEPQAVP
jgi:hypothetical protein